MRFLFCIAAACASPALTSAEASLATAPTCYDPVNFGAVADDGLSDRVPFQMALDAAGAAPDGGTVCVGPGRWTMERAPVGSYDRFAALSTHAHYVTLRGAGPETVLELVGDQGASAVATLSIDPSAEHIRIESVTFESSGTTNTDEQTHAIGTGTVCTTGVTCNPIRDIQIDRVTFRHPRNTPSRKGDCFRVFGGNEATRVIGVRVTGSNFEDCARSAIQIQRNVSGLVISGNTFTCQSCDQTIDGEATGVGGDQDVTIVGNTFIDGPGTEGDFTIALTNTTRGVIAGNTMNRGIAVYRSTGIAITGNVIDMVAKGDRGVIDAANICTDTTITGNVLKRTGHFGPLIKLTPHSGGICTDVVATGNTLVQGTVAPAISAESVSRTLIGHNLIRFTVAAVGQAAVYVRAIVAAAPVGALTITGNTITGAPTYAVELHGYPGSFETGVSITNNVSTGSVFGLRCNGPATGFTAAILTNGNALGPSAYGAALMTHGD